MGNIIFLDESALNNSNSVITTEYRHTSAVHQSRMPSKSTLLYVFKAWMATEYPVIVIEQVVLGRNP